MIATRSWRGWAIGGAVVALWLAIDRPWTIRPIESAATVQPFDATSYVDGIWPSRVTSTLEAVAMPIERMAARADGSGPAAVAVSGVVLSVDTSSRAGVALIDLDPTDGQAGAALQVGPVIRGTALRDALGFIRFTDFTNQIEFAGVAGRLNDRIVSDVLASIDPVAIAGRRVHLLGAAAPAAGPGGLPLIVAVRIGVEAQP